MHSTMTGGGWSRIGTLHIMESCLGHETASPQCQADHALMIRSSSDRLSTMTGGGHHGIEHRFESPKHRDGHVLPMNSYVH